MSDFMAAVCNYFSVYTHSCITEYMRLMTNIYVMSNLFNHEDYTTLRHRCVFHEEIIFAF